MTPTTRRRISIATCIQRAAMEHGYHLTNAESLDIARRVFKMDANGSPRLEIDEQGMWSPAQAVRQ